MSDNSLILEIRNFKKQHPEFKVMTTFENGKRGEMHDGLDSRGVFYSSYFYIEDQHMTLHCTINMSKEMPSKSSTIQLIGISQSSNFGNWKRINSKDLSRKQNAQIKEIFENRILKKLGKWANH
jgi:hypothetical protein